MSCSPRQWFPTCELSTSWRPQGYSKGCHEFIPTTLRNHRTSTKVLLLQPVLGCSFFCPLLLMYWLIKCDIFRKCVFCWFMLIIILHCTVQKNIKSSSTSTKATATRQYFPSVRERLGMRINLTPKLTAVLSGHGKTRTYLHRFNLRDEAKCICDKEDQTMDNLLFHCTKTSAQRDLLKRRINKIMNVHDNKLELITKYRKV